MRVLPILLLSALAAAPAASATISYPARGFDSIDLKAAAGVDVTVGPRFAVRAEGDPALLKRLTATVRGNTLVIGWMQGSQVSIRDNDLRVHVAMPRIAGAAVSGAGSIAIDRVNGPAFVAAVGGTGDIRVAALHTDRTKLSMSGTGRIAVAGTTGQLGAEVSGVGSVDALNLAARGGRFGMSGTGQIRARVDGPADVVLSGMGSVVVAGHPTCHVAKSGMGSVRCG